MTDEDLKFYREIVAEVYGYAMTFPENLRSVATVSLDRLVKNGFSQMVALLSYWLRDVAPLPVETSKLLGVAGLYAWWYYQVQDDLLDGDEDVSELLVGHLALVKMVAVLAELGLVDSPLWADLDNLVKESAEAHLVELGTRVEGVNRLTTAQLDCWTEDLIVRRAMPFYFVHKAHLYLGGVAADDALDEALDVAIRGFTVARQICDDASDWVENLKGGQLNYVAARFVKRHCELEGVKLQDLDIATLAGHYVTDEEFWGMLEIEADTHFQNGLEALRMYEGCIFGVFLKRERERAAKFWMENRVWRQAMMKPTAG